MKKLFKTLANYISLAIVFLPYFICFLEQKWSRSQKIYLFWAQTLALIPGVPGNFLRRAFYKLLFPAVSWQCEIGFGSFFSQPWAIIEKDVYIGPYCILGRVILREGVLIASRVSIPSGRRQHRRTKEGRLLPANFKDFQTIEIGRHSWIGEGAVVMASVGEMATVAAGAVVFKPVPPWSVVAGNPAIIIKKDSPS